MVAVEVEAAVSLVAADVVDAMEEVVLQADEVEGFPEGPTVQPEPIPACVTVLTSETLTEISRLRNGGNCPTLSEILSGTFALRRKPVGMKLNFAASRRPLQIIQRMTIRARSRVLNEPRSHKILPVEVLAETRIKGRSGNRGGNHNDSS